MKTFTHKDRSEVDLRVAQEIKNHQDYLYHMNQSIQALNENLVNLSILHEKVAAKGVSEKKSLEIEFQNLKQLVLDKLDTFNQRIGDIETKCMQMQLDYGDKLFDFSKTYTTIEDHVKSTGILWGRFTDLDEKLKKKQDFVDTEFTRVSSQVKDQIDRVRNDIPSVEEFKPLRKEMENTYATLMVDIAGLVKEIALLKKSVAYDQKKFENVYTLIERLKEGKQ